jgi:hypothetical protein
MWGMASGFGVLPALGQIDPVKRELIQLGYNAAFEGHQPLSVYAFYYQNQPEFVTTNLALRAAIAPTYLDSELGVRHILDENTDLGIGVAGGGFADSYAEVRRGTYLPSESFTGYGGEASVSLYHRFNPSQLIPLNAMVRGIAHYSFYEEDDKTASNFHLPPDHGTFSVRTGLRWGGREPTLFPSLAMALSVWYEGMFRSETAAYGFGDRTLEPSSHLFWGEALLAYTMPKLKHAFYLGVTAGTSLDADRLSCYRLGALLPMASEFPLSIPGYYYQELSARSFTLLGGNYIVPLDTKNQRWNVAVTAATAYVDYLSGLEQPGNWHSGVGAGVFYTTPSWRVLLSYGYGIDAMRSSGRGAHSIGILIQFDLRHAKQEFFTPGTDNQWRGFQRIFGVLGS